MSMSPSSTAAHSQRRSAAEVALSIPEILINVLGIRFESSVLYEHAFKGFSSALRVNRLWFECGTDRLWYGIWAAPHLLQVPPHRRQIYASKISYMDIGDSQIQDYYLQFKDLEFSRLLHLDVELVKHGDCTAQYLEPYFVPSLRWFSFGGPYLSADVLRRLQKTCEGLKSVCLHPELTLITVAMFSEFIRNCPSLQMVVFEIIQGRGSPISGELLSCLAQNRRIYCLELPWSLTEQAVRRATATTRDAGMVPFPALEELRLAASSTGVKNLASLVGNIHDLMLTVTDSTVDVLRHVSNLVNLRNLLLNFEKPTFIPAEELMALCALSKLESLDLGPLDSTDTSLVVSNFSDYHCEVLASHLPSLSELEFRIQCRISTNALLSFTRHCGKLIRCEIYQQLDTKDLFDNTYGDMIFPELKLLHLGGLTGMDIMSRLTPLEFSLSFERSFPGLSELCIEYGNEMEREYYEEAFIMWRTRGRGRVFNSELGLLG